MPLIAYQSAHGANDYPLHFAFFEEMQRRGLLDRYDFAVDPSNDNEYCLRLLARFPQLVLTTSASVVSRLRQFASHRIGKGAGAVAMLESRFDAVCEAPGGRIHPLYTGGKDIFWRYPRTKRRAILFHSVEPGILEQPATRRSVGEVDLVIARSQASAVVARNAGANPSRVIVSSDVVLGKKERDAEVKSGFAVALRIPNVGKTQEYLHEIREILNYFESLNNSVDYVRMESPMGEEQIARGYGTGLWPNIRVWSDNNFYVPFTSRREGVISCRLHTTLLSVLSGNRKILQFQIETGTSKIAEILGDIGLSDFVVHSIENMKLSTVRDFIDAGDTLDNRKVDCALTKARSLVERGFDAFEDWLSTLR